MTDEQREQTLTEWAHEETARRMREEYHPAEEKLLPPEAFHDTLAEIDEDWPRSPGDEYRTPSVLGRLSSSTCGWGKKPTMEELAEAMTVDQPTRRQLCVANVIIGGSHDRRTFPRLPGPAVHHATAGSKNARPRSDQELADKDNQPMAPRKMTLPEPAATVWRTHKKAIRGLKVKADGSESRLMLGGGTVMASRLNHRRSTDIDVFFPDLEDMVEGMRGGGNDLAQATKGEKLVDDEKEVKVRVRGGEIDAMALTPHFEGSEEIVEIDGEHETVLTNAQILRGKMERTNRAITRDAFDIVTAAKLDPRSLEIAVNAVSKKACANACRQIEGHGDYYARDIRERAALTGVPSKLEEHPDTLAKKTSQALRAHRYRRLAIELTDKGLQVTTERQGREPRTETYQTGKVGQGLLQSGALDHIATNWDIGRERLRHSMQTLAQRKWTGTVIDTEWGTPKDDLAYAMGNAAQHPSLTGNPATPSGTSAETDQANPANPPDLGHENKITRSEKPELAPPSQEFLAGEPNDNSTDTTVVRRNGETVGGTPQTPRTHQPDDIPGGPKR